MLYEMVTGQLPFAGVSPLDTLHAIAFEETRPITAVRPNLPPCLQRVVSRCLRKRAPDRYPDAGELAADLKAVKREVESGISSKAPLALKLHERWRALQDLHARRVAAADREVLAVLVVLLPLFFGHPEAGSARAGVYRHRRLARVAAHPHRRSAAAGRFANKVGKMVEVKRVTLDRQRSIIVVDEVAGTDLRAGECCARLRERQHVLRRALHARGAGLGWTRGGEGAPGGIRNPVRPRAAETRRGGLTRAPLCG